jgi:hypothetical protein
MSDIRIKHRLLKDFVDKKKELYIYMKGYKGPQILRTGINEDDVPMYKPPHSGSPFCYFKRDKITGFSTVQGEFVYYKRFEEEEKSEIEKENEREDIWEDLQKEYEAEEADEQTMFRKILNEMFIKEKEKRPVKKRRVEKAPERFRLQEEK